MVVLFATASWKLCSEASGAFCGRKRLKRLPEAAADRVFLPFLLIIFLDFWLYPVLQNVAVTMGTAARAPGERLVV